MRCLVDLEVFAKKKAQMDLAGFAAKGNKM